LTHIPYAFAGRCFQLKRKKKRMQFGIRPNIFGGTRFPEIYVFVGNHRYTGILIKEE
jgi:hypothetical protein